MDEKTRTALLSITEVLLEVVHSVECRGDYGSMREEMDKLRRLLRKLELAEDVVCRQKEKGGGRYVEGE